MSIDLFAHIKLEEKLGLKEQIVAFFKRCGFIILLDPDVDVLDSDGFYPIVVMKNSEYWKKVEKSPDSDIISGFELYIGESGNDTKLFLNEHLPKEYEEKVKDINCQITGCSHGDVLEFCMSYIFLGAMVSIFHGVMEDPQEGEFFFKDNIYEEIQKVLNKIKNEDFSELDFVSINNG